MDSQLFNNQEVMYEHTVYVTIWYYLPAVFCKFLMLYITGITVGY